jgi:hypothetical protein
LLVFVKERSKDVKRLLLAAIVSIAAFAAANAAEITYERKDSKVTDIIIKGMITQDDDTRFDDVVQGLDEGNDNVGTRQQIRVKLDSPGGSLAPGLVIAELIREHGWLVYVSNNTLCGSTCAAIWIAAKRHWSTASSLIGFHAAFDRTTRKEIGMANAVLGSRYARWGLSEGAIVYLTTAGPDEAIFLTAESAARYGIAYEGALPSEGAIQLYLQQLAKETPPAPVPTPPAAEEHVKTVVVQNLMLRRDPDPMSASLLEGYDPDYLPAGLRFDFKSYNACRTNYLGKIWCRLDYGTSDGKIHKGWANAFYLALDDGTRLACKLAQLEECYHQAELK